VESEAGPKVQGMRRARGSPIGDSYLVRNAGEALREVKSLSPYLATGLGGPY